MFKRYDADAIIHFLAVAREVAESIVGLAFICGGLAVVWFIGCSLA